MIKKFYTILALTLVLTLFPCLSVNASTEFGVIYDESDLLGTSSLQKQGEQILPQLIEELGFDIRVDILLGINDDNLNETAYWIYNHYDYGYGENKDGLSLTIYLEEQSDGSLVMPKDIEPVIYVNLSEERGSSQVLFDELHEATKSYLDPNIWNGEDMDKSAIALTQAVDAIINVTTNYFLSSANTNANVAGSKEETAEEYEQSASDVQYVFDTINLLSNEEWETLEALAQDISQRQKCGVYFAIVDDFNDYGEGSVYDVTTQIYHNNEFGYGSRRDGIIVLLSMKERDYAMFVYGDYAEYAFDSYGQMKLEETFLGLFGYDYWYDGIYNYLNTSDEFLSLADQEKPVRESYLTLILIMIAGSCLVSGVICYFLMTNMKSVHKKVDADEYINAEGLNLTNKYDRYTHTTETRTKIEKNNSSGGSTRSESGGGGSGRSGKF